MEEKITIKELTEYYVKRYNLFPYGNSGNPLDEYSFTQFNNIHTQIKRILYKKKIGETSYWKILKDEKIGAVKINIEEFEKQCFKELASYFQERYENCKTNDNFMEDKRKNHFYNTDEEMLEDLRESYIKNNNSFYENGGIDDLNEELRNGFPDNMVTEETLLKKECEMMLKALYDVFYTPFNREMLKYDLENRPTDNNYGDEPTLEQTLSIHRLSDYKNYIGKRKQTKKTNNNLKNGKGAVLH